MFDLGIFVTFLVFGLQLLFHNDRIKRITSESEISIEDDSD